MKKIDLTGQKFNRLLVLKDAGRLHGRLLWECLCDCGNIVIKEATKLKNGNTKSCGCYHKEKVIIHGLHKHPLYKIYSNIKNRCYNKNHISFHNYGGRGITVCARWLESFENFYEDVFVGYSKGLELDRKNNDKGYFLENCRWVTKQQNSFNRGSYKNKSSKYKGVSFNKRRGCWDACITKNGKKIYLGNFSEEQEAAIAYNKSAVELFGIYANLNIVDEVSSC